MSFIKRSLNLRYWNKTSFWYRIHEISLRSISSKTSSRYASSKTSLRYSLTRILRYAPSRTFLESVLAKHLQYLSQNKCLFFFQLSFLIVEMSFIKRSSNLQHWNKTSSPYRIHEISHLKHLWDMLHLKHLWDPSWPQNLISKSE